MNISRWVERAGHSRFYLFILNLGLYRMVPFNKPHKFRIVSVSNDHIRTCIPFRKNNLNHIRGLHACALATLSEFTSGFLLISRLDPARFRIIMKSLEMEYHYQGKMESFAEFRISDNWLQENIYEPLKRDSSVVVICEVRVHDREGHHISTGRMYWQVKSWDKVRTRIP